MIVWRIRGKIIRTVQCGTVDHKLYRAISTDKRAVLTGVLATASDLGLVKGFLCLNWVFSLTYFSRFVLSCQYQYT